MKQAEIKGIIPAIITPMNDDESINYNELHVQVKRQLDAGVHGLFPFGTNGEGYILSEAEKEEILSVVIEENAGQVPVYAGTGCIGTKDTIRQSQKAEALGADILSIITPSFAAASQDELYEHFKAAAAAVSIPVVLYNIPARTGNAIAPATAAKLADIDNIIGVKDSSGNFDNILQYIELTRTKDNFSVLSGNDSLILWTLMAGGTGGITGCANIYPETMVAIYEEYQAGNHDAARAVQDSIREIRGCFKYGNPNTIVKTAVRLLGYPVGKCRSPFNHVPEAGIEALKAVLKADQARGMR